MVLKHNMAKRSDRVPYNVLNNVSSVDILYEEARPSKKRKGRILGVYQAERLIARRRDTEVCNNCFNTQPSYIFLTVYKI